MYQSNSAGLQYHLVGDISDETDRTVDTTPNIWRLFKQPKCIGLTFPSPLFLPQCIFHPHIRNQMHDQEPKQLLINSTINVEQLPHFHLRRCGKILALDSTLPKYYRIFQNYLCTFLFLKNNWHGYGLILFSISHLLTSSTTWSTGQKQQWNCTIFLLPLLLKPYCRYKETRKLSHCILIRNGIISPFMEERD